MAGAAGVIIFFGAIVDFVIAELAGAGFATRTFGIFGLAANTTVATATGFTTGNGTS